MRALGIAVLGLFSGLLVGFLLTEIIAVAAGAATGNLPDSPLLLIGLTWLTPIAGIAGILAALSIDRRRARRRDEAGGPR